MIETLAVLGLAKITESVFTPILQDIAKQAVIDLSSSYIGKAFDKVFSVVHKKTLSTATGLSLKELLDLIEDELLDADFDDEKLKTMIPHLKLFIKHPKVVGCFEPLFIDPDYKLDPKIFADSWNTVDVPVLPEDFSWQRVAKRFEREVVKIRNKNELKETFDTLQANRNSEALVEMAGLPPEFDLDDYREALVERFGNLNFDSIDTSGANYNAVRLWSVFVPQSARECHSYQPHLLELPKEHQKFLLEKGEIDQNELEELEKFQQEQRKAYFDEPLCSILDSCNDPELHFMVVLGDPGSGKSTLLRYMALEWARNENVNERYSQTLPVLIELRDYNLWQCSNGKSFTSYLHHASNWHRLNQQTLDHLLKQPRRVVLLLDGLDEVFDPIQREQVVNDIHRFSNTYKDTRIIVTSRIVGYKANRLRDAGFRDFMLQDLDSKQIETLLQLWHKVTFEDEKDAQHKRERLSQAIKASPSIGMLAGNPLLLTMMAVINRYQELPRDRVLLYEKSAEVLLQQWDTERGLEDFPEISKEIDLRTKTAILRKVAHHMQIGKAKDEAANIIKGEVLTDLIEDYLKTEMNFNQSRGAANALVNQLRERNFILCFLGADSYAFVHRTFLEYFCAAELVHQFHKEQSLSIDGLKEIYVEHCQDDDWSEVLRLVCGQVDGLFVGEIVEALINKTDIQSWDGRSILSEIPLSIWCLGEARNISKLSQVGRVLFDHVCSIFRVKKNNLEENFYLELMSATKALNGNWPGAREVDPKEKLNSKAYYFHDFWPQFNISISPSREKAIAFSVAPNWAVRRGVITSLLDYWPDNDTRSLLTMKIKEKEQEDENYLLRAGYLTALAKNWPDNITRELLVGYVNHMDLGHLVLRVLADNWQDDATHELLIECAKEDKHEQLRSTALRALADNWRDDATRELLIECAKEDEHKQLRSTALRVLADNWRDDATRELLVERVKEDKHDSTALSALADNWRDDATRELLIECAKEVKYKQLRSMALRALADNWQDDATRELLIECAKEDKYEQLRSTALRVLADNWRDDATRELLIERAKDDRYKESRSTTLKALADNWQNDSETNQLLLELSATDGFAAAFFGEKHSEFGKIVFSEDLDGFEPYLDPRNGLTTDHMEGAAISANVESALLQREIDSLSEYLGWDIKRGSGK